MFFVLKYVFYENPVSAKTAAAYIKCIAPNEGSIIKIARYASVSTNRYI